MRRCFLLLTFIAIGLIANAGEVTEQQALQKAQKFMQGKQFSQKALRRAASTKGSSAYYVFNVGENGGFVIVAGDDSMTEILGYAERGNFDLANAPSNVRWWLGQYEKAANETIGVSLKSVQRRADEPKEEIAPFITTTWGQNEPYNAQCPKINGTSCVTGCVATAMSQVMNYYQWPETTSEIAAYTTITNQIVMTKLDATSFNWNNMTSDDIARLMLYTGQAVGMDYGIESSGAYDARIPGAMIGKFGYDNGARIAYRNGYQNSAWETLIYNELKEGRPVIYGGQSGAGGHSFICHGYRDNMFYINWGWNGWYDGYFALTALNPDGTGAYSRDQTAIIGIQKPVGGEAPTSPKVTVTKMSITSDATVSRNSSADNFTGICIECTLQNSFINDQTVQIGYALYQGTEQKQVLSYGEVNLTPSNSVTSTSTMSFGSALANGTYRIVPVYRENESSDWIADEGSDYRYVETVVADNTLTMKVMPDAAHDERLVFEVISTSEAAVRATNTDIGGDIVIPEVVEIEGKIYNVIAVANHGFAYCKNITSIKMPSSMKYWMLGAFSGCSMLKSLTIPKSLKFNATNSVGFTMEYCIHNCENLSELLVEEGNEDFCVENGALLDIEKQNLFGYLGGCTQKEYTMPESVSGMAMGAFSGNKHVEIIHLSSKIRGISIDAFIDCSALKRVYMSDEVTRILPQAFWAAGIEEIRLPSKLEYIGERAFTACKNLKSIEFPQSLNDIGDYAFADCEQLRSVIVRKAGPLSINETIFSDVTYENAILTVPTGCAKYYRNANGWSKFKTIEEIDMPDVVKSDNPFDTIEENQMIFGYYRSDKIAEGLTYGGHVPGNYKACLGFSKDAMLPFVGSHLKYFRFALADTKISNVKFWIGSSRDKTDIYTQNIESVTTGWNVVALDTPYQITGDSIFIGIEYTLDKAGYPVCYILGNQFSDTHAAESGSALIYGPYGENDKFEWSEENECLAMQCILEGDNLPEYDMRMTKIQYNTDPSVQESYYFKAGGNQNLIFFLTLKNWGKSLVSEYSIKAKIDDKEIGDNDFFYYNTGGPLNYQNAIIVRLELKIPGNITPGIHKLKLYVDKINGEAPAFPNDDSKNYTLRIYNEGVQRQKILIENITSTWCHDALGTNKKQDLLLENNDDLALIAYHCNDELSSAADNEYFKGYDGVVGLVLNANRYYSASSDYLNILRNMPSFANVNIDASYEPQKRVLNIVVKGEKNDEFDLLHSSSMLSVYLTEDRLVAPQYDEPNNTWINNYEHKGVLRTNVSNLWGDPIKWDGNHYEMRYSVQLDQSWNAENINIIAFIEEDLKGKRDGKPVINCNDFAVKDAEKIVSIDPVEENVETKFGSEIGDNTDLSNTVIDNTYYNLNSTNGDGYDATEQAIVLNSTTTVEQMNAVQNAAVGDAAIRENYNGIIFELAAGKGAVYVDVRTIGTHALNVQIGKGTPTKVTKTEREMVGIDYDVSQPTYVYLYATTASGTNASLNRASASGNSVLLYGYKVTPDGSTGISTLPSDRLLEDSWYSVDGRKLQGRPTAKGLYISNGRKVVLK